MDLRPGTSVTDNVRLVAKLREGAMGQVWVAEHLTLQRRVAVKFMSKKLEADEAELRERFIREAATAAQIRSQHVVQTHDQGFMADGTPYIVMELLEGESLADRLQRSGWLSMPETGQIVLQVSRALSSAHKVGIIHRDIKPENIFLCPHDEGLMVKVLDFGIARQTLLPDSDWDETDTLAGTPQYLSPELFGGNDNLDAHADLWALGVVAYRCLTGRQPFSGETLGLLSLSVMSGNHAKPSSLRRDLPAAVDDWFACCFARDKRERFDSAREMAVGLMSLIPASQQQSDDPWLASTTGSRSEPRLGADTFTPTGVPVRRWARPALGGAAAALVAAIVVAALALRQPARNAESSSSSAAPAGPPTESAVGPVDWVTTAEGTASPSDDDAGAPDAEPPNAQDRQPLPRPWQGRPPTQRPSPHQPRPVRGGEDYGF